MLAFQLEVRTDSGKREGRMTRRPVPCETCVWEKARRWPLPAWLPKADVDSGAENCAVGAMLTWALSWGRRRAKDPFPSL